MAKKLIADGKAFYGSRISGNILVTPEGFLICKNVPISRVGEQEYLGEELGLNDYNGQLITVIRREEDVFNPKSIASFEGKPFTNDHPTEAVTPENYRQYLKGHVAEIRRGEGIDADKLGADLFVNDPYTIKEIMEKGKREISCGYDCDYDISEDGKIYQVNIRGNHIALVDEGRAGHSVRIKDKKTISNINKKGVYQMKKADKNSIIGKMLSAFVKDEAAPEEIEEAMNVLAKAADEDPAAQPSATAEGATCKQTDEEAEAQPKENEILKQLLDSMEELKKDVACLKAKDEEASDPLTKLEEELQAKEAADEGEAEKPVSEIDEEGMLDEGADVVTDEDETSDEEPAMDEEVNTEDEEPTVSTADRKALIRMIRAIKPTVAQIKDPRQKKIVTDAITSLVRKKYPQGRKTNGYAAILGAQRKTAAKRAAFDSKAKDSALDLGKEIAKARNPHYKESK